VIAPDAVRVREVEGALVEGRWPLRPHAARAKAEATPTMSRHFLRALEDLNRDVLRMGGLVESALGRAVRALLERDERAARTVVDGDREVNLLELRIDEECLKILALHQPAARDLRFVTAVMKIVNDQERVGDLAVNVAERALVVAALEPEEPPPELVEMADRVRSMLTAALEALVRLDPSGAVEVLRKDAPVDELLQSLFLKTQARLEVDPALVPWGLQILSASKNLERIADHASNIAEDVVYIVDGSILRHRA
jgi:phosphate transport system protein